MQHMYKCRPTSKRSASSRLSQLGADRFLAECHLQTAGEAVVKPAVPDHGEAVPVRWVGRSTLSRLFTFVTDTKRAHV